MKEFDGKVAIVTGTTGIGRAIAKRFASAGADVLACGIEDSANRELTLEVQGGRTEPAGGEMLCHRTGCHAGDDCPGGQRIWRARYHRNAAAFHPFGTVVETDLETWNRCMMVNVGSIYLLAHFGVPEMKKRGGGSIINLASVQGHACQRGVAAYAASKGAVHSLTRALALDHAPDKIRVNSISPESIRTPMLERSAANFAPGVPIEEVFERWGQSHPIGRIGTPEEVAELAAFLVSDRAGFCTGGDYLVDGGLLAGIGVQ